MTVVNRRTVIAKRGHMEEVIIILNAEETEFVKRVYHSHYGPFDMAVMEVEFASVAEMEDAWPNGKNLIMPRASCPAGMQSPRG